MIDKSYKQWYEAGKKKPRKGFWWGGSPQDYDTPSPSPSYSGDYEGEAYGTTPAASYSDPSPAPSPSSDDNWDQSPVYNQPAPAPAPIEDYSTQDLEEQLAIDLGEPTAQFTLEERDEQGYGTPVSDWAEATIVSTPKTKTLGEDQEEDVARMMKDMGLTKDVTPSVSRSIDTGMKLIDTQKPVDLKDAVGKLAFTQAAKYGAKKAFGPALGGSMFGPAGWVLGGLFNLATKKGRPTDVAYKALKTSLQNQNTGINRIRGGVTDTLDTSGTGLTQKVSGREDVVSESVKKYTSLTDKQINYLKGIMSKRSIKDLENIKNKGALSIAEGKSSQLEKDIFSLITDYLAERTMTT